MRPLPPRLRVECKFSTGRSISVPRRELDVLRMDHDDGAGVIAALFWHGVSDPNGRWLLVDAREGVHLRDAAAVSLNIKDLARLDRAQPWLGDLRGHLRENWRPFLAAFLELALAGHEVLTRELASLHEQRKLWEHVHRFRGEVLELDHRAAMDSIVDALGESVAGHIFQDLLAYLLGMAGYRTVRMNPVGVPDIELEEPEGDDSTEGCSTVTLTRAQLERVIELAESAGERDLVKVLRGGGGKTSRR